MSSGKIALLNGVNVLSDAVKVTLHGRISDPYLLFGSDVHVSPSTRAFIRGVICRKNQLLNGEFLSETQKTNLKTSKSVYESSYLPTWLPGGAALWRAPPELSRQF